MSYTSLRYSLIFTLVLTGTVPGRCADHQQATPMSGEQVSRLRHSQGSRGSYSGKKKAWSLANALTDCMPFQILYHMHDVVHISLKFFCKQRLNVDVRKTVLL
jgi:hypothetical protein